MKKLLEEDVDRAFKRWVISTGRIHEDERLKPFLVEQIRSWKINQDSWIERTRSHLLLSARGLAGALGVTPATFKKYEEGEKNGSITLATLARVAEAMDCELVYGIRPKSRKLISTLIWERLQVVAQNHPWLQKCHSQRQSEALAFIVDRYLNDSEFRKGQGWSQRKNK